MTGLPKNILYSPYTKILFFIFPVVPLLLAFLLMYHPPADIVQLALKGKDAGFAVYDDRSNQGNSVSRPLADKEAVVFDYVLQKGHPYPYSGVAFYSNEKPYLDVSRFDRITVRISASKGRRIPVGVHTHIENYSRTDEFNTLKINHAILDVSPGIRDYEIDLSDLKTPEWWYTVNRDLENLATPADYSRVKSINIVNCILLEQGTTDRIRIEALRFSVNMLPYYLGSLLFMLIYSAAGFFIFRKKKPRTTEVNFVYEKTTHVNHLDKEEEAVFNFLTSNYHSQELTIGEIQHATGISEQKISAHIRSKTGMNFKQFLNRLRISEAKRLLKETDLQISEIAFKVGYGNISHFNRVFKEQEQRSPNEFRKQNETAIDRLQ